ncbi:DUF5931 domain-containing protein [Streptomyces sp. NBC_01754]|uniref:MacS family sensor histidine kinase n=1 Tax=Streptomyces sp. NBC_01754 TaxID=2975930 RepID=UPI002DD8BD44|nr:DUF5931 domain-containing protein [Streptomyces sp. NBC_01754]WSC92049.1 DUF5931 domain-containing protein [Streptomyces sp. NBC_01754]
MARGEQVVRMSVEQPLWRALTGYRVLTLGYAVLLACLRRDQYERLWVAVAFLAFLTVWTLATLPRVANAASCTKRFLGVDLAVALTGVLLTPLADFEAQLEDSSTLPSIWTAGSVLAFALKGGWRWAAFASTLVAAANIVERGEPSRDTVHNVLLVWVASIAIGYVVEVARASERTLARALEIEAATRERERLARDIHDGVLQVLAMVQRRGSALGGEAAELGRMAGEQEIALRTLVTGAVVPAGRTSGDDVTQEAVTGVTDTGGPGAAESDLRTLLAPYAGARTSFAEPGAPVPMAPGAARELAAAVGAALDNVRAHAGAGARAWILVEDEPDEVIVTVRDDGPGIPDGRLVQAEGEGRLGVALSIRGRLRELGGTAELISVPGQGTEVELKVPKVSRGKAGTIR